MARKQVDSTLKVADIISNNMGTTALKYRNNAPNDKSYFVTILGINRKFVDSVPSNKQNEIKEKYHIPETIEEGENNYYTIQINGEYYCVQQEGSFFLYDQVMAYLPNGDWSRMYLDYPVNYTEFVILHVFTQVGEPEEGMNVNDVWFKLDENENIVALYHYGLNEDTQENEWILDGKVESGGTGKFLDSGKTSVSHNDNEHNTSTQKYDNISGYKNSSTGTSPTTIVDDVVSNGANTIFGEHNTLVNGTGVVIFGNGNSFTNGGHCMVGGDGNEIPSSMFYALLIGSDNTAQSFGWSICIGQDITVNNFVHGAIFGKNHNIHTNGRIAPLVSGNGATITTSSNLMFVIGNSGNIFTVDTSGNVIAAGSITPGGADYAETYEWFDGNPDGEDRRGLFVTLDGKYIKLATSEDDYILGIISTTPSICGDTYDLYWKGKYRKNIFGEIEYDDKGNPIISDDYNSELKYIPQSQRKEKAKVGTQGKLVVVDDGTCQVNKYCKPSVNGVGTYTDDKNYYRVLERLDNTHIKIVIK